MSSEDRPRLAGPGSGTTPPGAAPPDAADGSGGERPHLEISDPKMMRALAHPLRVALIEAIGQADSQTLTATEASELLGESPANCAFHLRTLAKYGFVEEAGGGRGRQRPWRLRYSGLEISPPWEDQETRLAVQAAAGIWFDRWLTRARSRLMRIVGYPADWQAAAIASEYHLFLTAQEAQELSERIDRLIAPFKARWDDPSQRPAGSLRYEVLAFGYPLTDPPAPAGDSPSGPPAAAGPSPADPTPRRG
jgi:predicted transcriptional regulator